MGNEMNEEFDDAPSKSQRKRDADRMQAIGEKIIALPEARFTQLPLPDRLRTAVETARKLTQRGALRRQRQYIGRLMRELDTAELEEALQSLDQQDAGENALFHAAESWRERLINEGSSALEAFFDNYPEADRQRLRQLVEASRKELAAGNSPRQRRLLFKEIRRVLEAGFEQEEDTGKMPG